MSDKCNRILLLKHFPAGKESEVLSADIVSVYREYFKHKILGIMTKVWTSFLADASSILTLQWIHFLVNFLLWKRFSNKCCVKSTELKYLSPTPKISPPHNWQNSIQVSYSKYRVGPSCIAVNRFALVIIYYLGCYENW